MKHFARSLGALALVVVGVGFVPAPATAAYCGTSGVHVVVDRAALGGGVSTGCMKTTTRVTADRAFPGAGFPLRYVTDFPGAVCQVSGLPSDTACKDMPPGNAYWGLFEAHGGGWKYSTSGVGGVRLNPGDSVAFVWQNGGDRDQPGAAPGRTTFPTQKPTQKPSAKPTPPPTNKPKSATGKAPASKTSTKASTAPTASPSASASASAKPTAKASKSASASASPSVTPSDDATETAQQPEAETGPVATEDKPAEDGLPGWVPAGVVVGLSGAAAAAVAWRRRGV